MKYIATADTDIGISRPVNQDSILIKHGKSEYGEVLFAVVCDGMGGLAKGELASGYVVSSVSKWFDEELMKNPMPNKMRDIGENLASWLKMLNQRMIEYSQPKSIMMGTTFTGILFVETEFVLVHVGDSRLYYIQDEVNQLTSDHTLVAREVKQGNITEEQAKTDRRKNVLLQCVGASVDVIPEIMEGKTMPGTYMVCSDGFWHKTTKTEMHEYLKSNDLENMEIMHERARYLIDQVKNRGEKDNISIVLIKVC